MPIYDEERMYPPGMYIVPVHRAIGWYLRLVKSKGKNPNKSNVEQVLPLIVSKVFYEDIDEDELDLALNLDCIVDPESQRVKEQMQYIVQAELMAFFPSIAAYLSDRYWWVNEKMELIINVPKDFEDQRGNFF